MNHSFAMTTLKRKKHNLYNFVIYHHHLRIRAVETRAYRKILNNFNYIYKQPCCMSDIERYLLHSKALSPPKFIEIYF